MGDFGKRYECKVCGTEVLCTRAGPGSPTCDGQPMVLKSVEVRNTDQVD